ncbi:MAG: 50S ribosomal protein L15 [Candidatus Aenigmarchaeota archaeon ex4484_224]|nr:MAG: 50S ribosomal protein L15 [Candidatus Aenigmarchaeota archaeon ex4484_224]
MVVRRKAKKPKKFRGHRTYGYGKHKRARGAGTRGGRGKAGLKKHKWTYVVKYMPDYFGKEGFKSIKKKLGKVEKAINLKEIDKMVEIWLEKGIAKKENGKIRINLKEVGYDKVLGNGKLTKPLIIEAKKFSKKALEKIKAIGGEAVQI